MRKVFALLVVIFILACSSRRSAPIAGELVFKSAAEKNGQQVFNLFCDKCHPQGEAGLGPAINSNPAPQFIKAFQVRHGLGVMPSFKKEEISKKDLKDIKAYLKALKRQKPKA